MDNDALDQLLTRKSVRAYEERPVEERHKEAILQAALEAPTAGNMILYTILDITDQALKDRLAVTCDNQPFIARAPLVLIFAADYQRWTDSFRMAGEQIRPPAEGDLMLAASDALIAAQNTVAAAQALGLGSCYIGDILERFEEHAELLRLPRYVAPVCMVCYGYPAAGQMERKKPVRFDRRFIVQENGYRRLEEGELREMFREQTGRDGEELDRYLQDFCQRKYQSGFSVEMSRSVRKMIDVWSGRERRDG